MEQEPDEGVLNITINTTTAAAFVEKLRPLVGIQGWDYAVVWKLFYCQHHHHQEQEDQNGSSRYIEFMACCCAGAENNHPRKGEVGGGGGDVFPVVSASSVGNCCRDVAFQHSQAKPCCLLVAQLPSSIPLDDFGIHGQTLLSNQPKWLNFSTSTASTSSSSDPTTSSQLQQDLLLGTKALIPVPGGLIELFVLKQIPEDQDLIDFIVAQSSSSGICLLEPEAALIHTTNSSNILSIMDDDDPNYNRKNDLVVDILLLPKPYPEDEDGDHHPNYNNFQPPVAVAVSPSLVLESLNQNQAVPHEISVDRIEICNNNPNPINFLPPPQAKLCGSESRSPRNNNLPAFDDGSNDTFISSHNKHQQLMVMDPFNSTVKDVAEFQDMASLMANTCSSTTIQIVEGDTQHFLKNDDHQQQQQQGNDQKSSTVKQETNGRSGSISDCSDQIDDEDDPKHRVGRNGKGTQCKNLVAERRRRKKLNDRLYNLRALVPNISKLDRASILGDAIEYVKELQKQVKELQDELEEEGRSSDNEAAVAVVKNNNAQQATNHLQLNHNGGGASENGGSSISPVIHNQDSDITSEKLQQTMTMEPQVEVIQITGNELLVKVFWEHKAGGFVTLLEALHSIGLQVTNVNVTRLISLVSNVFHVERRKDGQMVEADDVRDSLLEITRNSSASASASGRWSETSSKKPPEMGSGIGSMDQQPPQHHHQHQLQHHRHHQILHNMHISSFHHLQHLYNQS